ncbi:MAG TPA: hypothetical protein VEL76_42435 [Gemmataceae bacterium]|nr:hypothetical protein [Gemmataceae bacterium]
MTSIKYMGYYDIPLIFITRYRGETYLFDCPFDEELEDDSDSYKVYVLPELKDEELPRDWTTLHTRATRYLGKVPLANVRFDPTRRKSVDPSVIDELTARRATAG